jgi:hypothetical protein
MKLVEIRVQTGRSLTVVALLTLSAITSHVAEATARVAGLLTATGTAKTTTVATAVATAVVTTLRAVTGDVANLSALVALLAATAVVAVAALGAFTRKVAGLSASVARLLLGGLLAFTAFGKRQSNAYATMRIARFQTYSSDPDL